MENDTSDSTRTCRVKSYVFCVLTRHAEDEEERILAVTYAAICVVLLYLPSPFKNDVAVSHWTKAFTAFLLPPSPEISVNEMAAINQAE